MTVALTVNGVSYNYPTNESEQWGVEATNWAVAVTEALSSVSVIGDIAPPSGASFVILDGQSSDTDVTELAFDGGSVRGAIIYYTVYRVQGAIEVAEVGTLRVTYKTNAGSWDLDRTFTGDDSGVDFTITSSGQIQYTSSTLGGSGTHTGVLKFRAYALPTS